jgi:hypothetical protein
MSIENLISDLKKGDNVNAGKQFNSMMADKLSAALDAKKIEIASNLQNRKAETKQEEK